MTLERKLGSGGNSNKKKKKKKVMMNVKQGAKYNQHDKWNFDTERT